MFRRCVIVALGLLAVTAAAAWSSEDEPEGSPSQVETSSDSSQESEAGDFAAFYRLGFSAGAVLQNNDYVKGDNPSGKTIRAYKSARFEVGFESTGGRPWQEIWNFPTFGFGFYALDFQDREDLLGNPGAGYGFAQLPILRRETYGLDFSAAVGLSAGWKPFDPEDNPENVAIGDFRAAYIENGLLYRRHLGSKFDLNAGVTWTHFSNGGTRQPNRGINLIGGRLMVAYQPDRPEFRRKGPIAPYARDWEWLVAVSYGQRDVLIRGEDVEGVEDPGFDFLQRRFNVYTVTAAYLVQPGHKYKFGGGVDAVYDEHRQSSIDLGDDGGFDDVALPSESENRFGVYGALEYVIYRMSFLFNLGYSVYQEVDQLPRLYQRLGGKYHFGNHFFVGMNLRLQEFSKPTHLEFNVGYRGKHRKASQVPGR